MIANSHSYWGTITARQGAVVALPGGGNKGDPAVITYSATVDEKGVVMRIENHSPRRRISRGANVIVAEPGDPCVVQVRGDKVFLWAITEGIPFTEACP